MTNPAHAKHKARLGIVRASAEKRLHILLVDSDDEASLAIRREFESLQEAHLDFTSEADTAGRMIATGRYDLVAVDPALPGGFALLSKIKEDRRWVATMVVTADQSPQSMRQAVKCRIDALLFKPQTPVEFMEQALLLASAVSARRHQQQKRVLAIGAHPDDVEIGCGGALAKHHARGDILHILTLSRGAAGGEVNQRAFEAHRAAELLGAKLKMGTLPDTRVSSGPETIDIIQDAIRELQPTHVYTHCAEDTHQDHRAVHDATLVAARGVPNVYCYQAPSSTVEFRPNLFVDISNFIKQKIQAIDTYKSQVQRMDALQDDVILATARYWGRYAGYVLAEPMRIVRQRDGDPEPRLDRQDAAPHSISAAG